MITLTKGQHKYSKKPEDGACIMELVSYMANEPWSDAPQCASSSITSFCIWINDSGDQEHRDRLLVLAPKIINTRDYKKEPERANLFAEYALWCAGEAKSAKSVKSAAEYAAEYAAKSAEYAAESATQSAQYAAEYAKSAAFRKKLYGKAIKTLEKVLDV